MIRRAAALTGCVAIAAGMLFVTARPGGAEAIPGTSCPLFPADSIFNADISTLPVHGQSAAWMSNMTQNANLHPDLGTFGQWYGIPINVAPPPTSGVTPAFLYDTESDHPSEGYPIDQSTLIEGGPNAPSGSDRHALVVNKNLCKLYEVYNLQNFTNGQQPQAGSGAVWDLNSDAMRPIGWTSADAAGLPITPLLLRPDEILAGSIAHAIRFTTHCTHSYIWPGSHDAGLCAAGYPPMGARFRLRSTFDVSGFGASTQVVLRAFQRYGLILADNGADWFFQGSTDDWWGTSAGAAVVAELKTVPAAQFDAVDESSLQASATSYQAVSRARAFKGMYTLDGFGGVHGDDTADPTTTAYWAGWSIARAAHALPGTNAPQSGFVLDGYGGLHAYGSPAVSETSGAAGHYWGFDIARDFAFMPGGSGGLVLDGYGGLHGFGVNGGAAPVAQGYSYFGADVAIKVVIAADGKGGYTLDAYGGLHPFGIGAAFSAATPLNQTGYWPWRAAIDIALVPGQSGGYTGYVLDRFGGLHPFSPGGVALPAAIATSYFGFDIARGVFFLSGSSTDGYTLDGYGGAHPFGSAPRLLSYPYWAGSDIARGIWGA